METMDTTEGDLLIDSDWDSLSLGEIDEYGKTIEDLLSIEPSGSTRKDPPKKSVIKENEVKEPKKAEKKEIQAPCPSKSDQTPISSSSGTIRNVETIITKKTNPPLKKQNGSPFPSPKPSASTNQNSKTPTTSKRLITNSIEKRPLTPAPRRTPRENIESINFDLDQKTPTSAVRSSTFHRKKRSVKKTSDNSLVIDVDASGSPIMDDGERTFDGSSFNIRKRSFNRTDNSFSALSSLDDTYDRMKLYAPEEDCVSIYSKIKPPKVQDSNSSTVKANEQNTIQLVTMLLNFVQMERARMGSEVLYEFLSNIQPQYRLSDDFLELTKKLLNQLMKFGDYSNCERILRMTIEAGLKLGESYMISLIEKLSIKHDCTTSIDIVHMMRDKKVLNARVASKLLTKLHKKIANQRSYVTCNGDSLQVTSSVHVDTTSMYDDDIMTSSNNMVVQCSSKEDSAENFTSAIENGNWELAGRSFNNLIGWLGDSVNNDNLLSRLVEMLIINPIYQPSEYILFDKTARNASKRCPSGTNAVQTEDLVNCCLSRISLTIIHLTVPGYAYHVMLYLVGNSLHNFDNSILTMEGDEQTDTTSSHQSRSIRNFIQFIRVAQSNSDFVLAKDLFKEYFRSNFRDSKRRIQRSKSNDKLIIELLCELVTHCGELGDMQESISMIRLLPYQCNGSMPVNTINELLRIILLKREIFGDRFNVIWLEHIANMLLERNEITVIRRTLSSGHLNSEKSQLFNYLEEKGLYCAPRIAYRPHLILLPHTMSLTEMTLSIYRHLTELVRFLMSIRENLDLKVPLRVVLLRKCGPFLPLDTNVLPEEAYFASEERLVETVLKLLKPPLRVLSRKACENTNFETMFNIDMRSVRVWFFQNTNYKENIQKSKKGLLQKPTCIPPPVNQCQNSEIEDEDMSCDDDNEFMMKTSTPNTKVKKSGKRSITNKIANVLDSIIKKPCGGKQ